MVVSGKKCGRPQTGRALTAAERARRYRARLRERGVRLRAVRRRDPMLEAVRFDPSSLLTPGERDVLRRFCAGFARLSRLPVKAAVFGSRARGGSDEDSDLDLAVFLGAGARRPETESVLSALAEESTRRYRSGRYGIRLRPLPLYDGADAPFIRGIREEMETVWTAPK